MKKKHYFLLIFILLSGLVLRLYHIEFGLPHSFYADEPEFTEPAIKYTYEIRNIIKNNDYYKLIPISFVYGTFPVYFYTLANMAFSKSLNLLSIGFDKFHLFVFFRVVNALISMMLVAGMGVLACKLFHKRKVLLLTLVLAALNWKLIVHAHYVNADIMQATLLLFSYLTLFLYYKKEEDSLFTVLTGLFLGLAVGTKITTLITFPLYLYIFLVKKDYKGLAGMSLTALAVYMVTNPFSFILSDRFSFRVLTMFTKEAGMVFDSVDLSPLKYVRALVYMSTPIVLLFSLYGKYKAVRNKENMHFHIFLISSVIVYLVFFSLQDRRVDRWLLPVLPIILLYAAYGIYAHKDVVKSKWMLTGVLFIVLLSYSYYPALLLEQFQRWTPKAAAYLWMQASIDPLKHVLVYTEEGLDPMNKLPEAKVYKIPVYASENAQFFTPDLTEYYQYVVISSRPLENHNRPAVRQQYPFYYDNWQEFEDKLADPKKFSLVKEFVLSKPNLIPLSDVFIYENLGEVKPLPIGPTNNP